jgi:hypothetical protein
LLSYIGVFHFTTACSSHWPSISKTMAFTDSCIICPRTDAACLAQPSTPLPTHPSQALAKQRRGSCFYFTSWILFWICSAQHVMAERTKEELILKLSQRDKHRSTASNPDVAMEVLGGARLLPPSQYTEENSGGSHFRRRDQTDPCDGLLNEANACLPQADPNCGSCVTSGFDVFLTTISQNFTCTDFMSGICPIVYQECTCAPCHTELDAYFNCLLNDVSNNMCPTVYCDPLKDFEATPKACSDEVLRVSECVSLDCLSCLDNAIESGAACPDFAEMSCAAIYTDCTSCLKCKNVVEPWLSCIAQESFSCDPLDCFPSNTTAPSAVPQALIVDTPTQSVPAVPPSVAVPSPTLDRGTSSMGLRDVNTHTWTYVAVGVYALRIFFVQ